MICPNCKHDLGDERRLTYCPHCGADLLATVGEGTAQAPVDLDATIAAPGAPASSRPYSPEDYVAPVTDETPVVPVLDTIVDDGSLLSGTPAGWDDHDEKSPVLGVLKTVVGIVLVAAAIAALAYGGMRLAKSFGLVGGVEVVDVTGWNVEKAQEELEGDGFVVNVVTQKDDSTAGLVLSQDPRGGTKQDKGETVTLTVADARVMPEVVGKTREEAEQLIAAEGIQVEVTEKIDDGDAGIVLSCDKAAGATLTSSDVVKLTVSKKRSVPDVRGMSESEARTALRDAGYDYEITYVEPDDDEEDDTVLTQDPEPGTESAKGTTVKLKVAQERLLKLEENAEAAIEAIYNCDPSTDNPGSRLRPLISQFVTFGDDKSADEVSDNVIWQQVVKRGQTLPDELPSAFGKLPRWLVSIDDTDVDVSNMSATVTFTVTWDWSSLGDDYAGVTSTDTRTVTITFGEDNLVTSVTDEQTDIPYYTVDEVEDLGDDEEADAEDADDDERDEDD